MDYDDSLTHEIPCQQPPEESIAEPHESLDDRSLVIDTDLNIIKTLDYL